MSRSNLIKLFLLIGFLVLPQLADAKTLIYNGESWEVNDFGSATERISIRNDLNLKQLAKNTLFGTNEIDSIALLDEQAASKVNEIMTNINKPPEDAHLVIEGGIAKEFSPGQNGQALDVYELRKLFGTGQTTIELPVLNSPPSNRLSDTNTLGINELVAIGESDFTGSPANRIHNIKVGAEKFNGLIIAQGEEFSFNNYLGDVDGEHGFLPELVIKKTGLTPEFGGGLCQVSSTAFRAAMNAGVPITERRNHSFAVQYYAPQGTDATIYPGVVDFKFKNDLNSPLLIRTRIEGRKLFFEYYGTKDTRTVAFEGPMQYDKRPDGSMKATWKRFVTHNGQTTDQTFNSTYQPPALFRREEQTATPNPQTIPTVNNQPTQTN